MLVLFVPYLITLDLMFYFKNDTYLRIAHKNN